MNDDTKDHDEAFTCEVSDEELEVAACTEGRCIQTLESTAANCC